MASNGTNGKKQMKYELSKTAGKQLVLLVRRHRLNADQIADLVNAAGEYAIESHKQGLAAMEEVADMIGEEAVAAMRAQDTAVVTPGDLRLIFDQQYPRKHGERRTAQDG